MKYARCYNIISGTNSTGSVTINCPFVPSSVRIIGYSAETGVANQNHFLQCFELASDGSYVLAVRDGANNSLDIEYPLKVLKSTFTLKFTSYDNSNALLALAGATDSIALFLEFSS